MNDAERIAYWASINDPIEMLKAIVENDWCLGGDAYYNDLRQALLNAAARVVKKL